jgi:hypothetical protein
MEQEHESVTSSQLSDSMLSEEDPAETDALTQIKKQAMEIHLLTETVTRKEHEIENLKIQTK